MTTSRRELKPGQLVRRAFVSPASAGFAYQPKKPGRPSSQPHQSDGNEAAMAEGMLPTAKRAVAAVRSAVRVRMERTNEANIGSPAKVDVRRGSLRIAGVFKTPTSQGRPRSPRVRADVKSGCDG